jgi:hypothetical protein
MRTRPGIPDSRIRTACGPAGLLAAILAGRALAGRALAGRALAGRALAGCALAGCALAGCTTVGHPAATASRQATQGASARATTAGITGNTDTGAAKSSPAPQQRAMADADAIFAAFAVPPGARKLASAPDLGGASGRMLVQAQPPQTDVVYTGGWWEEPGGPQAVLVWEQAHVSTRFSQADGFRETERGSPTITYDLFSLPSILGLLDNRSLLVQVAAAGNQTLIRVDAQVMWNPPRPAGEAVPSAARVVTLSRVPASGRPPAPVTITDPGMVRQLITLTNGLALYPVPPLDPTCLDDQDGQVVLTFRATAGGPALAVATAQAGGCRGVDFTVGGKHQPGLGGPVATQVFGAQVLRVAGLHWKVAW